VVGSFQKPLPAIVTTVAVGRQGESAGGGAAGGEGVVCCVLSHRLRLQSTKCLLCIYTYIYIYIYGRGRGCDRV